MANSANDLKLDMATRFPIPIAKKPYSLTLRNEKTDIEDRHRKRMTTPANLKRCLTNCKIHFSRFSPPADARSSPFGKRSNGRFEVSPLLYNHKTTCNLSYTHLKDKICEGRTANSERHFKYLYRHDPSPPQSHHTASYNITYFSPTKSHHPWDHH